jgi:hypothetical protein
MATPQLSINGFDMQENLVSTRDGRNIRRSVRVDHFCRINDTIELIFRHSK